MTLADKLVAAEKAAPQGVVSKGRAFNATWRPEPGQLVSGKVVADKTVRTKKDPEARVITINDETTKENIDVFATSAVLSQELEGVVVGDSVAVRFLGKQTSANSGNQFNSYNVLVEKATK